MITGQQIPVEIQISVKNSSEKDLEISYGQWAVNGPNSFIPIAETVSELKPGVYSIDFTMHGLQFSRVKLAADDFIEISDSASHRIFSEISDFWQLSGKFETHGFLHRRGYMLWGPAGSGKSSVVSQVIDKLTDAGGIAFMCNYPSALAAGLKVFREIEANRPAVCIFEDIDAIIRSYGEEKILSLLDGEGQIDHVVNIATTNYPEILDPRVVNRPRRFDRVIKVDFPDATVRGAYFTRKLPELSQEELTSWINDTEGFSFAAMAELIISVNCFGYAYADAIAKMKKLLGSRLHSSWPFDNAK